MIGIVNRRNILNVQPILITVEIILIIIITNQASVRSHMLIIIIQIIKMTAAIQLPADLVFTLIKISMKLLTMMLIIKQTHSMKIIMMHATLKIIIIDVFQ